MLSCSSLLSGILSPIVKGTVLPIGLYGMEHRSMRTYKDGTLGMETQKYEHRNMNCDTHKTAMYGTYKDGKPEN